MAEETPTASADSVTEAIHQSIHAEYRQALADNQWALAKANAKIKVQDQIIAELRARLGPATDT